MSRRLPVLRLGIDLRSLARVNVRLPNLERTIPICRLHRKIRAKYQAMPVEVRIEQKEGKLETFEFAILSASRAVASMPQ